MFSRTFSESVVTIRLCVLELWLIIIYQKYAILFNIHSYAGTAMYARKELIRVNVIDRMTSHYTKVYGSKHIITFSWKRGVIQRNILSCGTVVAIRTSNSS